MLSFGFTATRLQVATYLLAIALFSISFLVFLNATVSFVITQRIGQRHRVGDAVGTLGFADELVALIACPMWGVVSDRVGVRTVAVVGYLIVGLGLFLFVQAKNVYPQLLLARMFFSLGGAAASTMVTAILPTMTYKSSRSDSRTPSRRDNGSGHNVTPSISSELTITPARFRSRSPQSSARPVKAPEVLTSNLAGIVGMCTGIGALVALGVFLPLPARFERSGKSPSVAVADSFYVVGSIALCVAIACFWGLRSLPGEQSKSWRSLLGQSEDKQFDHVDAPDTPAISYPRLLLHALKLGFQDSNIGIGYLGGFVARASSVAISAFIPLFTNAYFINSGRCPSNPDSEDLKSACREAYILAAALSGVSQLVALLCAPVFGYLSGRYTRFNIPLLCASVAGFIGYIAFASLQSPDPKSPNGSAGIFFIVALLGFSQIGAIVCSLGILGRGIQGEIPARSHGAVAVANTFENNDTDTTEDTSAFCRSASTPPTPHPSSQDLNQVFFSESTPLIPSSRNHIATSGPSYDPEKSRVHLKGSIAGIYSLAGGAAILILTKVGGILFDTVSMGAPFWLMAIFNGLLFLVTAGLAFWERVRGSEGLRGRYEPVLQ